MGALCSPLYVGDHDEMMMGVLIFDRPSRRPSGREGTDHGRTTDGSRSIQRVPWDWGRAGFDRAPALLLS